jgi:hypothetical protein
VGDRSRGRYATSADFPLHDCSPYSHVHVRRESLGFVHRSRTSFCRPRAQPLFATFASLHARAPCSFVHVHGQCMCTGKAPPEPGALLCGVPPSTTRGPAPAGSSAPAPPTRARRPAAHAPARRRRRGHSAAAGARAPSRTAPPPAGGGDRGRGGGGKRSGGGVARRGLDAICALQEVVVG